jgi:hypothetical protein
MYGYNKKTKIFTKQTVYFMKYAIDFVIVILFGTDPDWIRALEKPPAAELIPCRRKPLRRTRLLRDPAQTQV